MVLAQTLNYFNNLVNQNCEELLACCEKELAQKNPLWLVESGYLHIKNKAGNIISLKLNPIQLRLHKIICGLWEENKPIRIMVLKARQEGISTYSEGIIYSATSQQEAKNSLIISDDVDGSNYLLEIIKLYHEQNQPYLKPIEKRSNEKKLEFDSIHSQILVDTANNENAGRKYTYHAAHFSELAFYPPNKVNNLMTGLLQAIPDEPRTIVIIESTANGYGNYFQEMWDADNDYIKFFASWFEYDDYKHEVGKEFILTQEEITYKQDVKDKANYDLSNEQMYWRRLTIANKLKGDREKFKQEYPAYPDQAFLVSGRPRFDVQTLLNLKSKVVDPTTIEGNWQIFEKPKEGRPYLIGADTADNNENSCNSVAQILDPIDFKIVAKFRGRIEPEAFGYELVNFGKRYNNALISVEANNHGLTTLTIIKQNYSNIFYRKTYDEQANKWTKKIGWLTTSSSKPFMIDNLSIALNEGLNIFSKETIEELITFVINDDGTCSAQVGKQDDEVMSLAVANQALIEGEWKDGLIDKSPKIERGSVAEIMMKEELKAKDWRAKYEAKR